MKNTREDLRTRKTYNALIQAFQELLNEKSFDEITVCKLCEKAQTRTATFYNHFSDKYDFFSFMIQRLRDQYLEKAELQWNPDNPKIYYEQLIRQGFDFIESHAVMVEKVGSDTLLTTIMQTSISESAVKSLSKHISESYYSQKNSPVDLDIVTQAFLGAMVQCSRWWFENRKKVSKETVINQLCDLINNI